MIYKVFRFFARFDRQMKAIDDERLQIVSSIMGIDYKAEKARTPETLGLDGYAMEELVKTLQSETCH